MLVWDEVGKRFFETGVDRGVLYPAIDGEYQAGVAWNGLVSANGQSTGGEIKSRYFDGIKYLDTAGYTDFTLDLEAYTYPDEFEPCDGILESLSGIMITEQFRAQFGLSYRTLLGNDTDGAEYGYLLHLVYGCLATPTLRGYRTIGSSVDPTTFRWKVETTPVPFPGFRPTAHVVLNSLRLPPDGLARIEDVLYGAVDDPRIVFPQELAELAQLTIIDNGDGTWTAIGPSEAISPGTNSFQLHWPSVSDGSDGTYTAESL